MPKYRMGKEGIVMKKAFVFVMALMILLCSAAYSAAQGSHERVWLNPVRYEIVLLKPTGGQWAATFNEVILLDTETGQTWTLKSKQLKEGWVLMPRIDQPTK
jgi:hypothetical protein